MSTMPTGHAIEHAGDADFQEKVMASEVPVLVDFYADWCGPCRLLAPLLEELAQETPNAKIVKVNVDHSPELSQRHGIDAVPTLMLVKGGRVVFRQAGLLNKSQLKSLLA